MVLILSKTELVAELKDSIYLSILNLLTRQLRCSNATRVAVSLNLLNRARVPRQKKVRELKTVALKMLLCSLCVARMDRIRRKWGDLGTN